MSKTVWKFVLWPYPDPFEVGMPGGSKILSVRIQRGEVCLWALVDSEASHAEVRRFHIVGTGHPIRQDLDKLQFIDTVLMDEGTLVWHVFEVLA